MRLSELRMGESGVVRTVGGRGAVRRRLMEMGVTPGARVTMGRRAPLGDPMEIRVRGCSVTLRKSDAREVEL